MRFDSYTLEGMRETLNLFDRQGLQVNGTVFVQELGELTVEYDGIQDRHYVTHFTEE